MPRGAVKEENPGAFWSVYVTLEHKPGRLRRYTPDHFVSIQDAVDYIGEKPSSANMWRILYRTVEAEVDEPNDDPAWGETAL